MKVCHKEAMKIVKELESKKSDAKRTEGRLSIVRFKDGEEKPSTGYDYARTRGEVSALNTRIRNIKHALAKANCKVKLADFDMTLGEGLVYLAQLNEEYSRIHAMSTAKQSEMEITNNGVVIREECLYDIKQAASDAEKLNNRISKLQVAIDRANLMNYIEIDE